MKKKNKRREGGLWWKRATVVEKDSCGGKKDNFVLICKAGVRGRSPWGARKISLGMYGPVGEKKKKQ